MKKMPGRIKYGVHKYRILRPISPVNDEGKRINGYCHADGLTIAIERGLELTKAQEFLLHELCHTTTRNTKVPLKHEEEIIELVSEGLLQILKDNPDLVAYLTQK